MVQHAWASSTACTSSISCNGKSGSSALSDLGTAMEFAMDLGREEDFAKPGTKNELLTVGGSSSLKPVLGQGNGLDTPLSTQSSCSGLIHCSEYHVTATRLEATPSAGLSTQGAQGAQVVLTDVFLPLHCRYNTICKSLTRNVK